MIPGISQIDIALENYINAASEEHSQSIRKSLQPPVIKTSPLQDIMNFVPEGSEAFAGIPELKSPALKVENDAAGAVKTLQMETLASGKETEKNQPVGGTDFSKLSGHSMMLAELVDKLLVLLTALLATDVRMKTDNMLRQTRAVEVSADHTIKGGEKTFAGSIGAAAVGIGIAGAGAGMSISGTVKHSRSTSKAMDKKSGLQSSANEVREAATKQPFDSTVKSSVREAKDSTLIRGDKENLKRASDPINTEVDLLTADMKKMDYQYHNTMMRANLVQQMSQPLMMIANATAEMEATKSRASATRADQDARVFDRASSSDADNESKAQKIRSVAFEIEEQILRSLQQTASHVIGRQA